MENNDYTEELAAEIGLRVAKEMMAEASEMQQHMMGELVESLEKGEDVYDKLVDLMLIRPFMERFIDELLKYEED